MGCTHTVILKKHWHVFFEALTGFTLKAAACIISMKIEADAPAFVTLSKYTSVLSALFLLTRGHANPRLYSHPKNFTFLFPAGHLGGTS